MTDDQLTGIRNRYLTYAHHPLTSANVAKILDAYHEDLGLILTTMGYDVSKPKVADQFTELFGLQPSESLLMIPTPVQYATGAQKEEIIRLLNHGLITRPEKTKMLLNINRLAFDRAAVAITKLQQTIVDRGPQPSES